MKQAEVALADFLLAARKIGSNEIVNGAKDIMATSGIDPFLQSFF
jgi:hypothetical protein